MTYGFGIVGAGMIAHIHARAVAEIAQAQLVAVCDTDGERAQRLAAENGGTAYTELEAFLNHPGLRIVTISTPSGAHLDPAVAASRAGKHLIVEKPLEVTLPRCDQIVASCRDAGVLCAGIFPSRFYPGPKRLKRAVQEGRFGRIVLADAAVKWFRSQEYYDSSPWKGTWKLDGGGALMNQSIHTIDLLQWIAGPVESVQAFAGVLGHQGVEVEDTAAAALRFASGALGVIEGSTAVHLGFPARLEVLGTEGSARLEGREVTEWRFARSQPDDEGVKSAGAAASAGRSNANDPTAVETLGHRLQFEDMIQAIEQRRAPVVDGVEARKAVAVIRAIYESAEHLRRVAVGRGAA